MAANGLLHIALRTRDLQMTEKFYTEILGLKVAFRLPPNMLFLRTSGSKDLLNFVKSKTKLVHHGGLEHFGFRTTAAGLKRLERNLKDNGVAITGRRGKHAIYFLDPNGYAIEYYCD
jgi:catechol 2,3-dioxygenase-like lactoylglutathione lyase family enzyme